MTFLLHPAAPVLAAGLSWGAASLCCTVDQILGPLFVLSSVLPPFHDTFWKLCAWIEGRSLSSLQADQLLLFLQCSTSLFYSLICWLQNRWNFFSLCCVSLDNISVGKTKETRLDMFHVSQKWRNPTLQLDPWIKSSFTLKTPVICCFSCFQIQQGALRHESWDPLSCGKMDNRHQNKEGNWNFTNWEVI